MSLRMQAMLLRFLETGEIQRVGSDQVQTRVDVRVIAATNRVLVESVANKTFREDLYYRINVIHLRVPPLRERAEDIPLLLRFFLEQLSQQYQMECPTLSAGALETLISHPWPGNVRELKNVIQRAVLMATGEELTADLLPLRIRNAGISETHDARHLFPVQAGMTLNAVERELIRMTLAATQGNKKEAAQKLAISRRTLYDKLRKHRLF